MKMLALYISAGRKYVTFSHFICIVSMFLKWRSWLCLLEMEGGWGGWRVTQARWLPDHCLRPINNKTSCVLVSHCCVPICFLCPKRWCFVATIQWKYCHEISFWDCATETWYFKPRHDLSLFMMMWFLCLSLLQSLLDAAVKLHLLRATNKFVSGASVQWGSEGGWQRRCPHTNSTELPQKGFTGWDQCQKMSVYSEHQCTKEESLKCKW